MSENLVTRAEFARLKNWDRAHVTRLAKQGKLALSEDEKYIDIAASEIMLAAIKDPAKQGVADRHQQKRLDRDVGAYIRPDSPALPAPTLPKKPRDPSDNSDAAEVLRERQAANAKREYHLANIAEMEEEKMRGSLLDRATQENVMTSFAGMIPAKLEQMLERVTAQIPDEESRQRVFVLLETEHAKLCEDLRKELLRWAEQLEAQE